MRRPVRQSADNGSRPAAGLRRIPHHVQRARLRESEPLWDAVGWSARKLREVEARVTAWAEANAPGALAALQQTPAEFARLVFALGGEAGLDTYERFAAMGAEGGAEAEARYRSFVADQVARGRLTQQQADDVTYLAATGVAAGTVLPGGRLGRTARALEDAADPSAALARRNRHVLPQADPRFHFPVTRPTGQRGGGNLSGEPTLTTGMQRRGLRSGPARQDQSAQILDRAGYHVHQNPVLSDAELSAADLTPGKRPDFLIENRVFDNYAPVTDSLRSIRLHIARKIAEGQTRRIVVNLGGTNRTRAELEQILRDEPIVGLQEVITIDQHGRVGHAYP